MRWFVGVVVFLAGCLETPGTMCGAFLCPVDTVCLADRCLPREQIAACANLAEGDACSYASGGVCTAGACVVAVCGNGAVEAPEVCDDGNTLAGDGCAARCDSAETCGNVIVDYLVGEQCDQGVPGLSADGCSSVCTVEVGLWRNVSPGPPPARAVGMAAYDERRDVVVMFGGNLADGTDDGETWELDRNFIGHWSHRELATAPPPRNAGVMVYDSVRQRVVLFGGVSIDGVMDDTWTYDGVSWSLASAGGSPPGRYGAAAAFDTRRGRMVLFGGRGSTNDLLDDTWEWDGSTWTERTGTPSPGARVDHAMAYDPLAERTVMWGSRQTWLWDGNVWSDATTSLQPDGFSLAGAGWDGTGVIVFGGETGTGPSGNTWRWDGSAWSEVATTGPTPRQAMAFTGTSVTAFGGVDPVLGLVGDAYQWSGTAWSPVYTAGPPARSNAAVAYDATRGKVIVFGGKARLNANFESASRDLWELDATGWHFGAYASQLSLRPAMAYNKDEHYAVFVSGTDSDHGGVYDPNLYRWDGTSVVVVPASLPSANRALAYDTRRHHFVLIAYDRLPGSSTFVIGADLVVHERMPEHIPISSTAAFQLVYDEARDRVLFYSGFEGGASMWSWDDTDWTRLMPAHLPNRIDASLVYDPVLQRVLLIGGAARSFGAATSDVFAWTGTDWEPVSLTVPITPHRGGAAAYDAIGQRVVLFGGQPNTGFMPELDETWQLSYRAAARPERCLDGAADTDGDGLAGCADPDCWGRCTPACAPGTSCDPAQPHCGDGACSAVEDYAICPADCTP